MSQLDPKSCQTAPTPPHPLGSVGEQIDFLASAQGGGPGLRSMRGIGCSSQTGLQKIETVEARELKGLYVRAVDELNRMRGQLPYDWNEARRHVRAALIAQRRPFTEDELKDATYFQMVERASHSDPYRLADSVAHLLTCPERVHAFRIARLGPAPRLQASAGEGIDSMRSFLVEASRAASRSVVGGPERCASKLTDETCVKLVGDIVRIRAQCQPYTRVDAEVDARAHLAANPGGLPPEATDEGRRARTILAKYPHFAGTLRSDEEALPALIRDRLRSRSCASRLDSILASIEGNLSRDEMQIAILLREFAYTVDMHEFPAPITLEGLGLLRSEFGRAIQELGR